MHYQRNKNCLWRLNSTAQNDNYFIELTYGEIKPRIVANNYDGQIFFVTMDNHDGYSDEKKSSWIIRKKEHTD